MNSSWDFLPVTVAIVVFAAVSAGPDVDVSQSATALVDTPDDGPHGGVARTIHGPTIVSRTPTGTEIIFFVKLCCSVYLKQLAYL